MGTDYKILENLFLSESSCRVQFLQDNDPNEPIELSGYLTAEELQEVIIKMVKVLSYISENPNEVLKRFNVSYEKDN